LRSPNACVDRQRTGQTITLLPDGSGSYRYQLGDKHPKKQKIIVIDFITVMKDITPSMEFRDVLKQWIGAMRHKEAADKLGVPLPTFRSWLYGYSKPAKTCQTCLLAKMGEK
jgi:hypothetical protein